MMSSDSRGKTVPVISVYPYQYLAAFHEYVEHNAEVMEISEVKMAIEKVFVVLRVLETIKLNHERFKYEKQSRRRESKSGRQ